MPDTHTHNTQTSPQIPTGDDLAPRHSPRPNLTSTLAYLTADLPGLGGAIKQRPEDFIVEEIPLYEPSGAGEHLFLYLEKCQRTTSDVVRRLAKVFVVGRSEVGYAGLKDKQAITRQWFSVRLPDPSGDQAALERLEFTGLKLLRHGRHLNKLRRGHLAANRFDIRIRQVSPDGLPAVCRMMDLLARQGVPNFIGEQRFGFRQNNHLLGRLLLRGQFQELLDQMLGHPSDVDHPAMRQARQAYEQRDYVQALELWPRHLRQDRQCLDMLRQGRSVEQVVRAMDQAQREFLISSLQSHLFNLVLDRRLRGQGMPPWGHLVEGDLAWKHDSGAVFAVDQATAELENGPGGRVATLAVSASGPMWGRRMARPTGLPAQWEQQALEQFGISEQELDGGPQGSAEGIRRPMRTLLRNPQVSAGADEHGPYIRLIFDLPRGSFATVALREIMKPELTGSQLPEDENDS